MASNPGSPNPWSTVVKLLATLIAAGVLVAGLALPYVGGLGLAAGHEADKFINTRCHLTESPPPQKTRVYASDGTTLIATLFTQDRQPVPLSQIPKYLQDALVATEDRRFYQHHGVDLRGLIRSAVSTSNGDTQGGSTLTMQYVKQIRYFEAIENGNHKAASAAINQNINRKIEDAKCALYIEGTLHESKAKILQNYLNIAFFGENAYGIQTAAQTYFGVPASKLTLDQSAMLVGILRAPSDYDPFTNRAAATARRNEVLQNLVEVGKLSQHRADQLGDQPISLATRQPPEVRQGCANASTTVENAAFFCQYAVNWLEHTQGLKSSEINSGGLKIVTTLDAKLQNSTQSHLDKSIPAKSAMTAVLPVVQPSTGNVLAMATSKTFGTKPGQTEQPVFTKPVANGASTYKLFPLLTALSTGIPSTYPLYTPDDSYKPEFCATDPTVHNGDANETYSSQETLADATARSSNTYFVALADDGFNCQLSPIVDMAEKLGITGLDAPSDLAGLTVGQAIEQKGRAQYLVLGSIPTSPLQLAGAYATIANRGRYNAPAPILSITDASGNAIAVKRTAATQVVSPYTAAQAVEILHGDTTGVGTSAERFSSWYSAGGSDVAGKTGTIAAITKHGKESQNNAAIWFVGVTKHMVATSALINFNYPNRASRGLPGEATGAAYGDYASKVWLDALSPTLQKRHWTFTTPDEVKGTQVPSITNDSVSDARKTLAKAGFKLAVLGGANGSVECPIAGVQYGNVAFYGPQTATLGSTITVCVGVGVAQKLAPPPPPVVKKQHSSGHSGGSGSGSGGSGGGGNGGGSGGGSGGGGNGSGSGGGSGSGSGSGGGGSGSGSGSGSGGGSGGGGGGG